MVQYLHFTLVTIKSPRFFGPNNKSREKMCEKLRIVLVKLQRFIEQLKIKVETSSSCELLIFKYKCVVSSRLESEVRRL